MASVGKEDVEYESDPEVTKRSLAMRRREAASDDEEGEEEAREKPRKDPRAVVHSDESDDQGGAAEYDDDEELEEEEEGEEEEEIDEEEEFGEEVVEEEELERYQERGREGELGGRVEVLAVKESSGDGRRSVEGSVDENGGNQAEEGEEKKENEPFAVPTAGAFYMHDDRFRENSGGRHSRRTHGGRKLWESKDERKWGHDKFEEITLQERRYEEGKKPSKGPYVGRGRNRGIDRGSARGNRSKEYENNNQRQVPKGVRGRGPRKYEPAFRNNRQAPPTQNKQSGKPAEKNIQSNLERTFTPNSNAESGQVSARKNSFASSLNSASPPFYPSGSSSSNKDITLTPKRDAQVGSGKRNLRSSVVHESFNVPQTNALERGKNISESVGMDKLYRNDSTNPAAGKTLTNIKMSPSGLSFVNTTQAPQSRVQGRGVISGQMSYQPVSQNQMTRASLSTHLHAVQRNPAQNRSQLALQGPAQQVGQRPGSGSQASSPPKTTMSSNSFESGEVESPSDSSKSKGALLAKGKGSVQGSARGSITYGGARGAPVTGPTGSMGVNHDQNFPGAPAFLPVMQFGGHHTGGMGVPAVGVAFPGYVGQPQLGGLGNSGEMTWLPVLAGAAGALGATYCPPYMTVDGSYHGCPSGQTSSVGSLSKENNANKTNNELKPSQKPEIVGDEHGQRQNKPRRYSQMNVASEVLQNNTELV